MGGIESRPLLVRPPSASIAIIAVILIGLATGLSSQQTPAPSLTLLSKDARRNIPVTVAGEQELVALDDLAAAFQLQTQESLGSMTVGYKGKTIILTADQPLASVSGRMVSLSAAPTRRGSRWLVPLDFASRALGPIYDTKLDLRRAAHLLVIGDLRVPRVSVRFDPLGGAGRLTVETVPKTPYTITQDRDRLLIKFDADAIEPPPPFRQPPAAQNLVQNVHVVDPTTLAVDLGRRFASYKTAEVSDRLIIDLAEAGAPTGTPSAASPAPAPVRPVAPAPLSSTVGSEAWNSRDLKSRPH